MKKAGRPVRAAVRGSVRGTVRRAVLAADRPTRQLVAASILEHGPATTTALAELLGLTPAAVRRHLGVLVGTGLVETSEQRVYGSRGRGRPAKVFGLTDAGREAFTQGYDDIAVSALQFLGEFAGEGAVVAFAQRKAAELERRYRPLVAAAAPGRQAQALAEALTADGYAASVAGSPAGDQLCQHHCPVAHVAVEFPQLCEAETEVFARLLGRHVQRLATIAHGDGVCTTNVPGPMLAATRPTRSARTSDSSTRAGRSSA